MNRKYLTIGIMAIVIIGLGIFLYGCTTEPAPEPTPIPEATPTPQPTPTPELIPEPELEMAMAPYVEFEATVISLSLKAPKGYYEGNEIYRIPQDSAVIRIDKIIETGGSSSADWSSIGVEEGKEVSLDFKYTVRPTKIITLVGETTESGGIVSHQIVPTTITFENNYFVFRKDGSSETETILPGLQEGSKFKTTLWETFEVIVEKYEIIS